MSYSLYQQISHSPTHAYKLLQLPPDLVEYMKTKPDGKVSIKSSPAGEANNLVLCTEEKTWKLRQMNKSSAVLIVDNLNVDSLRKKISIDKENVLLGFAQTGYEYELTDSIGSLNFSKLPKYSGTLNVKGEEILIQELIDNSPISTGEFYKTWYLIGGCEIDGKAQVLSDDFITECLSLVIILSISNDWKSFSLRDMYGLVKEENPSITFSIVETVVEKFKDESKEAYSLNELKIAKWFGIELLKKIGTSTTEKDFLLSWKRELPEFYNIPLDLVDLQGYYFRPIEDRLQYLSPTLLSSNLSVRFDQLFKLNSKWNYTEFIPFVMEFVPKGKSVDSIILKHGKKKKIGGRLYVTSR